MSLTEQLFGGSSSTRQGDAGKPSSSSLGVDLQPMTKTNIDLFARAPQVKKLTRKDKEAMLRQRDVEKVSTAKKAKSSDEAAAATGHKVTTGASTTSTSNLFDTIVDASELEKELADESQKRDARLKKTGKKHILRHALHANEEEDTRTVFVGNLPNTIHKRDVEKVFKDCGPIEAVRIRCQALEAATDDKQQNVGRAIRILRGDVKKEDRYSATAYVLFRASNDPRGRDEEDDDAQDDKEDAEDAGKKGGQKKAKKEKRKKEKKEPTGPVIASHQAVQNALAKNGLIFKNRHITVTTMDAESRAYPPETSIFLGNVAYGATEEDVWNFFIGQGIQDVKRVRLVRDRETGDCKGFGYVEFYHKSSVEPAIATRGSDLHGKAIRIVHVNKSKEVRNVTESRRDRRKGDQFGGQKRGRGDDNAGGFGGAGQQKRGRFERRDSRGSSGASFGAGGTPSWMGVVTNPRKKIPRDLRDLSEGKRPSSGPKGPRAPVKRKMRNPEKGN